MLSYKVRRKYTWVIVQMLSWQSARGDASVYGHNGKVTKARELCWADHDEMIKDYNDEKGAFLFRWKESSGTIVLSACKPFKTLLIGARASALKSRVRKLMRVIFTAFRIGEKWTTTSHRVGDSIFISSAQQRISTSPIAAIFLAKIFLSSRSRHNENDNRFRLG